MASALQQSRYAPKPVPAKPQPPAGRVSVDDAENLEKFLSRLNFGVGKLDLSASPRIAPSTNRVQPAHAQQPSVSPVLSDRTNERPSPAPASDTARRQSFKEAVHQAAANAQSPDPVAATAVTPPTQTPASIGILSPPPTPSDTASHPKDGDTLPFAALPYTLRSSSLGTGGVGTSSSPPLTTSGLAQSRYATGTISKSSENRNQDFERRATNALAQQDAINRRIAALKARHEEEKAQVAQREAAKRRAEEDAKRAAEEEVKRRTEEEAKHKAEEEAKFRAEEEVKRAAEEQARRQAEFEAARREAERQEAERVETERRLEAERKEATRLAQEKAEAERRERERVEAEQREAARKEVERKEVERQQAERKAAERKEAERAEAEREKAERAAVLHAEAVRKAEIHEAQAKIDKEEAQQLAQLDAQKEALQLQVDMNQQVLSETDAAKAAVQKQIEEAQKQLSGLESTHEQAQEQILEAQARLSALAEEEAKIKEDNKARKENVGKEVRQFPITDTIASNTFAYMEKIATRCMKDIDRQNVETEHKLRFKAWPKPDVRPEASQVRRVKLTNLSTTSTFSTIQSLVWGGRVEQFFHIPGTGTAQVLFMKPDDCMTYYEATCNGIEIPGEKRVVFVELCPDPEPIHEFLRGCITTGVSRCVRTVNVDPDWGMGGLTKLAAGKGRKVERVINGQTQKGLRTVEFRFTNINDAFRFKLQLDRDEDWEAANVVFGDDPCATNTGIHTGIF